MSNAVMDRCTDMKSQVRPLLLAGICVIQTKYTETSELILRTFAKAEWADTGGLWSWIAKIAFLLVARKLAIIFASSMVRLSFIGLLLAAPEASINCAFRTLCYALCCLGGVTRLARTKVSSTNVLIARQRLL